MHIITQDSSAKFTTKSSTFDKEPKYDFLDDYNSRIYTQSKHDNELEMMGFETIEPIETNTNISSMFSPSAALTTTPPSSSKNGSISDQPSSTTRTGTKTTPGGTKYNTYDNDSAQKKFGGAKAISSDQFFNKEASSFERSANLAKFQGSNSISSAEYFGDGTSARNTSARSNLLKTYCYKYL